MGSEEDSPRTFVPVPPSERPRRTRRTARVLLIDDLDRILLFADSDPGIAGSRWWMTPGGGIDPGESDAGAAVREIEEETGLRVTEGDLLGPTMRRAVVHGYSDVVIDQHDVFYACWVPAFEVSTAGHTEDELLTMADHRWWTRAELAETDEEIWPGVLLDLWREAELRRDADASADPVDGGSVEESSVPV